MFVGEVTSPNQEPEFSEKEDDEWILVDFIGKVYSTVDHHSTNGIQRAMSLRIAS